MGISYWDLAVPIKGIKGGGSGQARWARGEMAERGGKRRKCTEGRKGRCKRRLGEDATLHPQSSVRLHKYWVHGWVAGSQVNMTYEYCRSHSIPSSIINVWLRVGSTFTWGPPLYHSWKPVRNTDRGTNGHKNYGPVDGYTCLQEGEMSGTASRESNDIYTYADHLFLQ